MKHLRYMSFVMLIAVCFGASLTAFAQEEKLTNNDVVSLVKAGLSTTIIVNKIRSSKTDFDLSTDGLIALKQAGVTDEVVGAMFEAKTGKTVAAVSNVTSEGARAAGDPNDPNAPHDYGIYMFEDNGGARKMTQLAPTVSAQNRTGGLFTSSMTYGISKVKIKANLPGPASKLQLKQARPVFYFYLDAKSGGLNTSSGIPSTPNEFALIRFNVRSDNREVTIGKMNAFGGKGGLSDEYVVAFDTEDLGGGVFKITPKGDLKNGEYGFYLINSGNSNASSAVGSKFFDFGIKLVP
ncbi:MAG TPA: hypothetical protein VGC97_13490 [Pyrinomonadaceae bacterium]